jgi:hypothetical protein
LNLEDVTVSVNEMYQAYDAYLDLRAKSRSDARVVKKAEATWLECVRTREECLRSYYQDTETATWVLIRRYYDDTTPKHVERRKR